MCTACAFASYTVRAPLAEWDVSSHVLIPFCFARFVKEFKIGFLVRTKSNIKSKVVLTICAGTDAPAAKAGVLDNSRERAISKRMIFPVESK